MFHLAFVVTNMIPLSIALKHTHIHVHTHTHTQLYSCLLIYAQVTPGNTYKNNLHILCKRPLYFHCF